MKRILGAFLRWTVVFAVVMVFGWAVYRIFVGELPKVSREIIFWNNSMITLPFALPHYLDFLAAPILAVLVISGVRLLRFGSKKAELRALVSIVGALSMVGGTIAALSLFFGAGMITVALIIFPMSVFFFALFSALLACATLVEMLFDRFLDLDLSWLLDRIDWLGGWMKKNFFDF